MGEALGLCVIILMSSWLAICHLALAPVRRLFKSLGVEYVTPGLFRQPQLPQRSP